MIWALLAAYITKRPPWVQALVFGLCVGLFVAAAAEADERDTLISSAVLLVLSAGVVTGGAFYVALRAQMRQGWAAGTTPPTWVTVCYSIVWILSVVAAIRALFGAGGFKVAVLSAVGGRPGLGDPPALAGRRGGSGGLGRSR